MRLPNMAVFHTVGAAVMAMIVRLARRMNFTGHRAVAETPDLNRVADLADQLAARILAAIDGGELTAEELAEVDLILRTATILQQAGIKFPPNMCRLGEKAAEQDR
jgi:copper homeostasis protein CutC